MSPSSNHPGIDFSLKDRPEFNSDSRLTRPVTAQTPVQDYIDEHLFIEALALAAFEVVYREPQPSNIEKVSKQASNQPLKLSKR